MSAGQGEKGKWTLLAFLCGTFFIYTVDRSLLGILAIPIQAETGIPDTRFGVLNAAVFWTYAALVPFAGVIGDRFSRTRVIGFAALAWSVMTLAAGFAGGFWSLLALVSFAITAPQTLYGPSALALIASSHRRTRSTALSCHQAAYYTGWFASGAAVAVCLSLFRSWRSAYFVFGGIGIVAALAFIAVFGRGKATDADAAPSAPAPTATAAPAAPAAEKPRLSQSLAAFFCCPSALLAASGYVAMNFVSFGYSVWAPKFVAVKFSLDPGRAGAGTMFWHYAAAFAAILAAGFATDFCVKRWPRFRLALQSSVLLLSAPLLAAFGFAGTAAAAFAAAAAFGAMRGLFEANAFASLFDVIPGACRSAAVGFLNVIAGLVGSTAPILLGHLSDTMGLRGFEVGFAALGVTLAAAAGLLAFSCLFTFRRDRIAETAEPGEKNR